MSLRRFLLESPPVGGEAVLDEDTSKHVVKVMRLREGEGVTLFDGRGREWRGIIIGANRRGVRVSVGEERCSPPPAGPRLVVATAVPKGKRMSTLLAMVTEAGVDVIVPLDFVRSAVKGVRAAKVEHWGRAVVGASRQCGRAWMPAIEPETGLAEFLARPAAAGERRLLATTTGSPPPLASLLAGGVEDSAAVVILVGPEGGFTEEEEKAAVSAGFEPFTLGENVLRIETAALAAVVGVRCLTQVRAGLVSDTVLVPGGKEVAG